MERLLILSAVVIAVNGYSYMDCYRHTSKEPNLDVDKGTFDELTANVCNDQCTGYIYFGTRNGNECWCGDKPLRETAASGTCDLACSGDRESICGGANRMSAYETESDMTTLLPANNDEDSGNDADYSSAGDYDGQGLDYCSEWGDYTVEVPGIVDALGVNSKADIDYAELETALLELYATKNNRDKQTYCINRMTCDIEDDGLYEKCDSENPKTRIEGFHYSNIVEYEGSQWRLIFTNGIPDHCYEVDQGIDLSSYACEQYRMVLLPIDVVKGSNDYANHGGGTTGIAVSGANLFRQESVELTCNNAVYSELKTFDPCDGHPSPICQYHYHKNPICIADAYNCGLLGYMLDGVPAYGYCTVTFDDDTEMTMTSSYELTATEDDLNDGEELGCDTSHYTYTDGYGALNEANGYTFLQDATGGGTTFKAGDYAYFFTQAYPFTIPGSFNDLHSQCYIYLEDLKGFY